MTQKQREVASVKKLKKKGMYQITFQNDEEIKITEDVLVKYELVKGKIVDDDLFKEIKTSEVKEELFLKTLNYISYQPRSTYEIKEYLKKLDASITNTNEIIKELNNLGYLDDKKMSEMILSSTVENLKGPKKYEEKLFKKGIRNGVIYSSELEDEVLDKAIKRNLDLYKKYPKKRQSEKLATKLISLGFTSSKVFSKVSKVEFTDEAINTIDNDIEKLKRRYASKYQGRELKNHLAMALMRKGYEYSLISKKLNIYIE